MAYTLPGQASFFFDDSASGESLSLSFGRKPSLEVLDVFGVRGRGRGGSRTILALLTVAVGIMSSGSNGGGGHVTDSPVDVDSVWATVSRIVAFKQPSRAGWTRGSKPPENPPCPAS